MDQVKQFEQQIFAAIGSSDQISPEEQEQAYESLPELYQNIDMIEFCISNFDNFENNLSKIFTLNIILFWIKDKFQELSSEIIQFIQEFLFSSIFFSTFHELPEELLNQFISSQSQFVIKIFIDEWDSFFTDLIFTDPNEQDEHHDLYVKKFLNDFCKNLNFFSPTNYSQIMDLRSKLQQSEISNQIIQYCIEKCSENDEMGYHILSYASNLLPIDNFLDNDEFQNIFQQGLSNPNTIIFIFDSLSNIISSQAESSIKAQILNQYINPDNIFESIKKSEDQDVFVSAAHLTGIALTIWQSLDDSSQESSENLGSQYFNLILNFIQYSEQASSQVFYSAYTYIHKNQDAAIDLVKELVNRIIANFSEQSVLDYFKSTFQCVENYTNIIISAIKNDPAILQYIESFESSFDFAQNPGVCSMMIYIISQIFQPSKLKDQFKDQFGDYLNLFVSILDFQPPYSPAQIICFCTFHCLAIEQPTYVDADILSAITSIIIQIVMMDGLDDSFREFLLSKFPIFPKRCSEQRIIQIDQEYIDEFVQTSKSEIVSAASKAVQNFQRDEKFETNQKYIEYFAQELLENEENDENKLNIYISALSYIAYIFPFNENTNQVELATQILESATTNLEVLQDETALSALIEAIPNVSYKLMIPAFKQILQYCKGLSSLSSICKKLQIAFSKLNPDYDENSECAPEFIDFISQEIENIINEYVIRIKYEGRQKNIEFTIKNYLDFIGFYLSTNARLEWNDHFGQITQNTMPIIQNLLSTLYDSPIIYSSCMRFITNMCQIQKGAKEWSQEYLEYLAEELKSFASTSLNIIFNSQIEILSDAWKSVLKLIYIFHTNLIQNLNDDSSVIDEQFQKFGAPADFIDRYLRIKDLPNRLESVCLFYNDLSICFHELNTN